MKQQGCAQRTGRRIDAIDTRAKDTEGRGRKSAAMVSAAALLLFAWLGAEVEAGSGPSSAGQGQAPKISSNDDKTSLVIWVGDDGDGAGIVARLVDKHGRPLSDEIVVNTTTAGMQEAPAVTRLSNGDYLVVWQSDADGDLDVVGRRVDRAGLAIGLDFLINGSIDSAEQKPAVAHAGSGRYAVVLIAERADGSAGHEVVGQVFDEASDQAVSGVLRFGTTDAPTPAALGVNEQGSFLVTWKDDGENIKAQSFDRAGLAIGLELQLNARTSGTRTPAAVASLGDDEYYVVWEDDDGDGSGIFGRRVSRAGLAIGLELQINPSAEGEQRNPSVGRKGAQNLVVVWEEDDGSGAPSQIMRRFVHANGQPFGNVKSISGAQEAEQRLPAVSPTILGSRLVTWQDEVLVEPEPIIRLNSD